VRAGNDYVSMSGYMTCLDLSASTTMRQVPR
jgi:hypothetical protein